MRSLKKRYKKNKIEYEKMKKRRKKKKRKEKEDSFRHISGTIMLFQYM
jgi:hypothetical protein